MSRVSGVTIVSPLARLAVSDGLPNRGFRYRCTPGYSKVAANAAAIMRARIDELSG